MLMEEDDAQQPKEEEEGDECKYCLGVCTDQAVSKELCS